MTDRALSVDDELPIVEAVAAAPMTTRQTIRSYVENGMLRAVRVGNRHVQVRASALGAFLAAGETPDRIHGLAAFHEARWSARGVKSTEGPAQEARAGLAEALDALALAPGTFGAVLGAARSDPSPA